MMVLQKDMNAQSGVMRVPVEDMVALSPDLVRTRFFPLQCRSFPVDRVKDLRCGIFVESGCYRSAANYMSRAWEEHVLRDTVGTTSWRWRLVEWDRDGNRARSICPWCGPVTFPGAVTFTSARCEEKNSL